MAQADLLFKGATVLTLDAGRRVLPGGFVAVAQGRITAVGTGPPPAAREEVEAAGLVLLPGFVQAHVHLCQSVFRNAAEGLSLLPWLRERIWPLEAAHDAESLRASAELGLAEMIRSGTTAALDMGSVRHTEESFAAADRAGFRLTGGKCHMDTGAGVPAALKEEAAASLAEAEALCRAWQGAAGGRLRYAVAPRFALTCSDALLEGAADLSRRLGARLHTHASESRTECAASRARFGADPIRVLHRFGLTGGSACLAHGVWLAEGEPELLAETGTHVVHCPSANLKLGSGVAPVPELRARGVNVGLGADGAACNNNLDAFMEMRLAALIHNPRCGVDALPAAEALAMATMGGARALGLEPEVGSLEAGKQADLLLLDLRRVHATPAGGDPHATVVHCAGRGDVAGVWVEGRCLFRNGRLLTLDEERVRARAGEAARRLLAAL